MLLLLVAVFFAIIQKTTKAPDFALSRQLNWWEIRESSIISGSIRPAIGILSADVVPF